MLRMRLTRVGSKKRPAYRVIVADSRAPRDGRHVDIVGQYDPMTKPSTVNIDVERAVKWLRNGAQPSDRVRVLLRHSGVLKAHEEARLADKRSRKESAEPTPVRAAKQAAGAASDAARGAFKVIVKGATRAAGAVADVAEDTAGAISDAAARRSRTRAAGAGAAKGSAKSAGKRAKSATKTAGAATKRAAKSTSAAKSAEKTAARKAAAKSGKTAKSE